MGAMEKRYPGNPWSEELHRFILSKVLIHIHEQKTVLFLEYSQHISVMSDLFLDHIDQIKSTFR